LIKIGVKGTFVANKPFDSKINIKTVYRVISINKFAQISDMSPLETIYMPVNLTNDDYQKDLKNDVSIIGLQDVATKAVIYIPENRITGEPTTVGHEYVTKIIGVKLPPIPVNYDLTSIRNDIYDIIKSRLNIEVTTQESNISSIVLLSDDEHNSFKRKISVPDENKFDLKTKNRRLENMVNKLKDEVKTLKNALFFVKTEKGCK
jgi:hypothetical protein